MSSVKYLLRRLLDLVLIVMTLTSVMLYACQYTIVLGLTALASTAAKLAKLQVSLMPPRPGAGRVAL